MSILAGALQFVANPILASPFLRKECSPPLVSSCLSTPSCGWSIISPYQRRERVSSIFHQACRWIKAASYGKARVIYPLICSCMLVPSAHIYVQLLYMTSNVYISSEVNDANIHWMLEWCKLSLNWEGLWWLGIVWNNEKITGQTVLRKKHVQTNDV